ncbi:carbohydrate kinase (thermoresistant glucokinase family) [Curtobacterium pusillum]|uniref:Gluconokinase n=1 Tax=Curtobacterium pusillum TaxID=69373 RepID=A0AAW3SZH2_9MICO|nr:carbohydrate kinase (thermoresistant glucokinase family) [Curtobacterium pusillum]
MSAAVKRVIYVMGVAGCGKSSVGVRLAQAFDADFLDADTVHPAANIEKMSRGEALTDEDRWPWLQSLATMAREAPRAIVIGCSALRRSYRDVLREGNPGAQFVHLTGSRELLAERLAARSGHFMPASLLGSQLQTLEPLEADEAGVTLDVAASIDTLVADAAAHLRAPGEHDRAMQEPARS